MRHFKRFVLTVLVALVGSLSASAHDFEAVNEGSTIYYNITSNDDLTCAVTYRGSEYNSYNEEYSGSVVIPSSVEYNGKTYSVTSISEHAFYGCSGLTSITIPNSVTSIRYSAFYGCSGLTSVTIPNSVTLIGDYAFENCSGLTSVYITDIAAWCEIKFSNVLSNPLYYAHNLYLNNELVTNLVIPNGVTSIGSIAFFNCSDLTSITIPNSVTSIGDFAFGYCCGLTSVYITDIAAWCEIEFGGLYSNPLYYAHNLYLNNELVTNLVIPNGVTSIGSNAFYDYSCLTSITIPNSVTSIGDYAFSGCSGLTSITIPNSVISIGDYAFNGCNIKKLMLGTGLTTITNSAFMYLPIEEIYVSWTTPAGLNIYNDAFSDVYKITLYVPIGCTSNYETRSPWNNFKEIKEYMLGGNEGNEKCAAPTISVENNNLLFSSITPNAKFYYTIDCDDVASLSNSEDGIVKLNATYNIKAYAYAEGYDNSETVSAILVWVNPTIQNSSNIISMEAKKAVVIKTVGGNIQICGTEQGERIQLYSASGILLNNSAAVDGETTIPYSLQRGETYIIKYGDKSIKYQY